MRTCTSVLLALCSLASAAHAQDLLVVASSDKVVMLVSGVDGSLLDKSYLDLKTSTGTAPIWPTKAIEVGDEIWINDAHTNKLVFVFDRGGNYLREFHGGERPYGLALAYGRVWVSNPTIPVSGRDLREFDTAGNLLNVYPIWTETHCFDLMPWNGALLLSDKSGNELDLWDTSGNDLGKFHEGGGPEQIEYPLQIANRASNGNLLFASDTFSPPVRPGTSSTGIAGRRDSPRRSRRPSE